MKTFIVLSKTINYALFSKYSKEYKRRVVLFGLINHLNRKV